jgi:hypothetical protein
MFRIRFQSDPGPGTGTMSACKRRTSKLEENKLNENYGSFRKKGFLLDEPVLADNVKFSSLNKSGYGTTYVENRIQS